jgi:hypothetical protein
LAFEDFCSPPGDDPTSHAITLLQCAEVRGDDRLLVINVAYSLVESTPDNPLDTAVDPDSISFTLFEAGSRVLGLNRGAITNVSEDFDEPLGDNFWLGEE